MATNDELAMDVADDDDVGETITSNEESKFMKVCRESFRVVKEKKGYSPDKLCFEEWKTCVSIMIQAGIINIQDPDLLGKIHQLDEVYCAFAMRQHNAHQHISRAEFELDEPFYSPSQSTVESRLEHLTESNANIQPLEYLEDLCIRGDKPSPILHMLASFNFCAEERLTTLALKTSPLNAMNVETLCFQVVPRFPNLKTLFLCAKTPTASDAKAFQAITTRIQSEGSAGISSSLRTIGIPWSYPVDHYKKSFWGFLLECCVTLDCILGSYPILLVEGLGYLLLKNLVGRRVLGKDISLALWPTLLHRAQIKIDTHGDFDWTPFREREGVKVELKASGIYYLLREGSALIGRSDLGSK